ncbi:MAG: glycosyltransferase [Chloroflexota bacterium]
MSISPAKYLFASNARHMITGYGNQTNLFAPMIKRSGREIAIFAFYGQEGAPTVDQDGILTLPRMEQEFGNDIVLGHYQYVKADVVLSLIDPRELDPEVYAQMNWCAWSPIDSTPASPANLSSLQAARWIWVLSKFGQAQLQAANLNSTYVPHGVDVDLFRPIDRAAARHTLSEALRVDLDGKFIVMVNAANRDSPSRKGFYETFAAFKLFAESHPDALLYMHTRQQNFGRGEDLAQVAALVGLDPTKIIYAPQYALKAGFLTPDYLNAAYNACDVLFSTSHAEGFGLPLIEAQAAGCPVVVTDSSAMSELVFAGKKIRAMAYMPQVGYTWQRPIVEEAADQLSWAYENWHNEGLRAQARDGALAYDYRVVFSTYMLPALEQIEAELA